MKYSIEKFKGDIKECINLCNVELNNRRNGINGESTIGQLEEVVIPELNKLLKIEQDDLPPTENRFLDSFASAFKDWGWNMRKPTKLYVMLLHLDVSYKKL
ncbi:MAG: hypothetical protein VB118_11925 [Oscillospiraceae bacterium]|nr:hypothetical protein [Oscillospiraceae bacterium]